MFDQFLRTLKTRLNRMENKRDRMNEGILSKNVVCVVGWGRVGLGSVGEP